MTTIVRIRERTTYLFRNAVDLFRGRLRRRTCYYCGRRHWNGNDITLPYCFSCLREWREDYRR
jgi:hypothetical protein